MLATPLVAVTPAVPKPTNVRRVAQQVQNNIVQLTPALAAAAAAPLKLSSEELVVPEQHVAPARLPEQARRQQVTAMLMSWDRTY